MYDQANEYNDFQFTLLAWKKTHKWTSLAFLNNFSINLNIFDHFDAARREYTTILYYKHLSHC